jgi:hypothetical protein
MFTQASLWVLSERLLALFRYNRNFSICLFFSRVGLESNRPMWPNFKFWFCLKDENPRILNLFLYLNFLGCKSIFSLKS